jgi:peptidoglycan-associated lipoprotein
MLVHETSGPAMEKAMIRKASSTVVGVIVFLSSCKSAQNEAPPPVPGALSAASTQPDAAKLVQPASRELAEILLALQRVHFAFDSSELTRQARSALDDAAEKLARYPSVQLEVAGHADERGTSEYNLALGERRARAVTEYLTWMGVASDQLRPVSYGEEQPLMAGATQLAWAKNRRVDFRLLHGDVKLAIDEGTLVDDRGQPLATDQAAASTQQPPVLVRKLR